MPVSLENFISLGAVHKRRPQSGGRGYVQCGRFSDKGGRGSLFSASADVRTFWCKNLRIFRKFMVCPQGQGEGSQFFAILCGRLYGRPYIGNNLEKNFWIIEKIYF